MVVSVMEQYPIEKKAVLPLRADVEVKKGHTNALPRFSRRRAAAHRTEECFTPLSDATPWCGAVQGGAPVAGDGGGQQQALSSRARPDLDARIKKETLRRAHQMIEQQLRLRQAEAKLQTLIAGIDASVNRMRKELKDEPEAYPVAPNVASATPPTQTTTTDVRNETTETAVVPLVSIRRIQGVASCTSPSLDTAADNVDQRRKYLQGGPLRGLLQRPKGATIAGEDGGQWGEYALFGNNVGTKVAAAHGQWGSTIKQAPDGAFISEKPSASLNGAADDTREVGAQDTEAVDVAVRRLVGLPKHDRGLYAALRSGWKSACKAKTLARMLWRQRVRSSSWWRLAGSREGMLEAARALGLEPAVYQAVMMRWVGAHSGTAWAGAHSGTAWSSAKKTGAGAAAVAALRGVFAHSGRARGASPLDADDEEMQSMLGLARQLGQLKMRGMLTSEMIALLHEGDVELVRQEVNNLLNSEEMRMHAALQMPGSEMNISETDDASFHEMAKVLLQEKRHAAMAAMEARQQGKVGTTLGLEGSAVGSSGSRPDSVRYGGKTEFGYDSIPPSLQKLAMHGDHLLTPGETAALWAGMDEDERKALIAEAEAEAEGGRGSKSSSGDVFARLPPLRGADDGEALLRVSRGGRRGRGRRGRQSSSSLQDLSKSETISPFGATQKPGGAVAAAAAAAAAAERAEGRKPGTGESASPEDVDNDEYRGPEWWKKQQRPPPGPKGGWRPAEQDNSIEGDAGSPSVGTDDGTVDHFTPPRQRRRTMQDFGASNRSGETSARLKGQLPPPPWTVERRGGAGEVRERPRKVSRFVFDGKLYLNNGDESTTEAGGSDVRRRRGRRELPRFVRRSKNNSALPRTDPASSDSDHSTEDSGELSSLFENDDEELVLFLATFPEEEHHVRLRNEAKGVLGELGESSSLLVNYATKARQRQRQPDTAGLQLLVGIDTEEEEERAMRLKLDKDEMQRRFEEEAHEEHSDLWQTLLALRKQVLAQEAFLDECNRDVHNLSYPSPGEDRDAFAMRITQEVNEYAKTHRLDPQYLRESADARKDYATAVRAFLESFALTRGRRLGHDVGVQCTPEELGYVDADVQRTEEQMEDLYFHARGLLSAIRLTIVAVANVMGFHASLELESTCKRCFFIFESPRTLWPCGHTFCQQCLTGMLSEQGELICDECGSLCEVGYTPNLALDLVASYQVMQNIDDEDEDEEVVGFMQRRTIEGVLASLLRDLTGTQNTLTDAPCTTACRSRSAPSSPQQQQGDVA
ncbi:putative helicase [Trypanosoma grayi]|uniref:putative helicase n=1 Tax=Trypanosoma grayi TaxID=71804 RepID=UPI0004F43570|nr:putative helicase [Trypanosoma grayi]KEG08488.1 putative helicase [Trypanosoma grayi]